MFKDEWAIGVDLGGTNLRVAVVDAQGRVVNKEVCPVDAEPSPLGLIDTIVAITGTLRKKAELDSPVGIGVAVAGQIEGKKGVVRFAPNLNWRDVPLKKDLESAAHLPVAVLNDVRAAAWGEWLHGAGTDCDDLLCLFIGTGVGGGIVSGGQMLTGCSDTAGECGHVVIERGGRRCHCGNRGCLEAMVGGWAIAERAQEAIADKPEAGAKLLELAGGKVEDVTAETVASAFRDGDSLAKTIIADTADALVAGATTLVNVFNPCRLILGGGVIEGLPELIERVEKGIRNSALKTATHPLQVLPASLGDKAGIIGAASWARRTLASERKAV